MDYVLPAELHKCPRVEDIDYLIAMVFLGPYNLTSGIKLEKHQRRIKIDLPNKNTTGGMQGEFFDDKTYEGLHRLLRRRFFLRSSHITTDANKNRGLVVTGHSVIRLLRIRQLANPENWKCLNRSFSSCTGIFRCLSDRSLLDGHVIGTRFLMGRLGLPADTNGESFGLNDVSSVHRLTEIFPHLEDQHREFVNYILGMTSKVQPDHNSVHRAGRNGRRYA